MPIDAPTTVHGAAPAPRRATPKPAEPVRPVAAPPAGALDVLALGQAARALEPGRGPTRAQAPADAREGWLRAAAGELRRRPMLGLATIAVLGMGMAAVPAALAIAAGAGATAFGVVSTASGVGGLLGAGCLVRWFMDRWA